MSDYRRVKAAANISMIARNLGLAVRGRSLQCPNSAAHTNGDRNPSARLYRRSWRCHACGAFGDVIDLAALAWGVDVHTAMLRLAPIVGVMIAGHVSGSSPPTPPTRPAPHLKPSRTPSADVALLLRSIDHLSCVMPSHKLKRWGQTRGISERALVAAECSDFTQWPDDLRGVLSDCDGSTLQAVGFIGSGKDAAWGPARELAGHRHDRSGVFLPLYDRRWSGITPRSWRWRSYGGTKNKASAPYGWSPDIVGLGRYGVRRHLVLCEGEVDFLSVLTTTHRHKADDELYPLGLCRYDHEPDFYWLDDAARRGLQKITLVMHGIHKRGGQSRRYALALINHARKASCDVSFSIKHVEESHDLNDMLQAGELSSFIGWS